MFSADCTEAKTLSQAHIHWLEIRCALHHIPHKYLTSYHKPVFIGLKCRCGLHPKLKELNVFYLPTLKQVVGYYKSCNEVMFWFTQMMCYNVYIPLLIRQANDVEENPGPTIFDIIDPTTTVSADSSQGSETIFGVNAGKVMCSNVTYCYYIPSNTRY